MQALRKISQSAGETEKSFREFAYAVSHDLSAPLRAVVEFSRLLGEEKATELDEEGRLYLAMILEGGEKMQAMMAALLDYSRLNTTAKPLVTVDCKEIVNRCLTALADKISARQVHIEVGELPTLQADPDQLFLLFMVLLDNAMKFYHDEKQPHITVQAEAQPDAWRFTVTDSGIGIDERFHESIFQPFKRLHTDSEFPGVGMGLTLARKVVERHGGNIWVESASGQGTSLVFILPKEGIAKGG